MLEETGNDIILGGVSSILTFNMSVTDRNALVEVGDIPFQIMPSTNNFLSTKSINDYIEMSNPKLLIHMNYITKPFSISAVEINSKTRVNLRQYRILSDRLGTKNILIHTPDSEDEYINTGYGMKIIHDELIKYGKIIHFELPVFSLDLQRLLGAEKSSDPIPKHIHMYMNKLMKYLNVLPHGSWKLVIDTAHMWGNGCDEMQIINILEEYSKHIEYIHLNGNIKRMFSKDTHAPIFSKSNLLPHDNLSKYISSKHFICICEITKEGAEWKDWEAYASKYNLTLVPFNHKFSY